MEIPNTVIGIDIGKKSLMMAFPPSLTEGATSSLPAQWPTLELKYATTNWWNQLIEVIDPRGADVIWESCNYLLFAPILAVLKAYRPMTRVWVVNTNMTKYYRESFVNSTKTDAMDARAPAFIGRDIICGKLVRNIRLYNMLADSPVNQLRMYVNLYVRLKRDYNRHSNRLNGLGHSLCPGLGGSETWLRAVRLGFIDPDQLHQLAAMQPPHPDYTPSGLRYLKRLVTTLPRFRGDDGIINTIQSLDQSQQILEEEIGVTLAIIHVLITAPPFEVVTRRWQTLPQASPFYLATFHAATYGRIQEFSKNQFRAAVGACPSIGTSGDMTKPMGPRRGYRPAKSALYMWTMTLVSNCAPENRVRTYYEQGRSFSAAKNKLARILWGVAHDTRLDG
jgi:hypothetical protein